MPAEDRSRSAWRTAGLLAGLLALGYLLTIAVALATFSATLTEGFVVTWVIGTALVVARRR